jgi:hypothetical protein
MSDKHPKLPKEAVAVVCDTIMKPDGTFAFTYHYGCARADEVTEAARAGKDVPAPIVDMITGRTKCHAAGHGVHVGSA